MKGQKLEGQGQDEETRKGVSWLEGGKRRIYNLLAKLQHARMARHLLGIKRGISRKNLENSP